jgi:hypothetical protein
MWWRGKRRREKGVEESGRGREVEKRVRVAGEEGRGGRQKK